MSKVLRFNDCAKPITKATFSENHWATTVFVGKYQAIDKNISWPSDRNIVLIYPTDYIYIEDINPSRSNVAHVINRDDISRLNVEANEHIILLWRCTSYTLFRISPEYTEGWTDISLWDTNRINRLSFIAVKKNDLGNLFETNIRSMKDYFTMKPEEITTNVQVLLSDDSLLGMYEKAEYVEKKALDLAARIRDDVTSMINGNTPTSCVPCDDSRKILSYKVISDFERCLELVTAHLPALIVSGYHESTIVVEVPPKENLLSRLIILSND